MVYYLSFQIWTSLWQTWLDCWPMWKRSAICNWLLWWWGSR